MHDAKINVSLNLHIFFRVQKMKFHGEEQSVLGDFLIRFASIGIFAYSTFNMVAGGLGPHSDLKNLLILATGGITIIQVFQLYYWSNNNEKKICWISYLFTFAFCCECITCRQFQRAKLILCQLFLFPKKCI